MIINPIDNCSLDIVLSIHYHTWWIVLCCLPNSVNVTVTRMFSLPDVLWQQIWHLYHWWCNWILYQNTVAFYWQCLEVWWWTSCKVKALLWRKPIPLCRLYTPAWTGLKFSAFYWVMMLHKAVVLFCLWICTNNNFFIEMASFSFCCSCLWSFASRCSVFFWLHSCLFCTLNYQCLKLWTILAVLDTFWCIIPFHTCTYFLDITFHFLC
jgi:hypothetical protein